MNVFVLDERPRFAALYHCDKHVVKMVVETCQLLSTAHWHLDAERAETLGICKYSHVNHPAAIWARTSDSNYEWLRALGLHLAAAYSARYSSRQHAMQPMLARALAVLPAGLPTGPQTPHAQCMPERYKGPDAVHAYRLYYVGEKLRFARWRHSPPPDWLDEYLNILDNLGE